MAYTDAISIPLGITGLTLNASFVDSAGTLHASLRNLACTEIGTSTTYDFTSALFPDDYLGSIRFHTGTVASLSDFTAANTYAVATIGAQLGGSGGASAAEIADAVLDELLAGHTTAGSLGKAIIDILAKAQLITSGRVTIVSPVNRDGTEINIYRGDDYFDEDGRSLSFVVDNIPDMTGGEAMLRIEGRDDIEGEIVDATHLYFELEDDFTEDLTGKDSRNFQVRVTLANGHKVTPFFGTISLEGQL